MGTRTQNDARIMFNVVHVTHVINVPGLLRMWTTEVQMVCEANDLPPSYFIIGRVSGDGTGVLSPEAVEYFTVTPAQGGKEKNDNVF